MTEDDDIDGLAAEYVLGSLDPAERRQVDARRQKDASLAAAVAAWERRLAPLGERGRDAVPPAHLRWHPDAHLGAGGSGVLASGSSLSTWRGPSQLAVSKET